MDASAELSRNSNPIAVIYTGARRNLRISSRVSSKSPTIYVPYSAFGAKNISL
jgi:hypothetical protein